MNFSAMQGIYSGSSQTKKRKGGEQTAVKSRSKLTNNLSGNVTGYLEALSIRCISFSSAASTFADWRSPRATRLT